MSVIKKLIAIANELDKKGLYKEAEEIDAIVSNAADQVINFTDSEVEPYDFSQDPSKTNQQRIKEIREFDKLSKEQATVLASVAFQYGSSFKRKDGTQMNFYSLALNNDWQGVYDELMDFKDNYPTRRKEEAAYLKKYLKKIK